jgi:hypothetical protein
MEQHLECPWHPLPADASVHLVAIERRAVRKYRSGPPTKPAHVVWSALVHRDATTHERFDLPVDVVRALLRDGGRQIRPMMAIPAPRLNAAVERAARRPEDAKA